MFPESLTATGASFTEVTVISNVLVTSTVSSVAVYVICGTTPLKFVAGTNVKLPSELMVKEPSVMLAVEPAA